jgi:hypothetical protein
MLQRNNNTQTALNGKTKIVDIINYSPNELARYLKQQQPWLGNQNLLKIRGLL